MNLIVKYSTKEHAITISLDSTILDIKRQLSQYFHIDVDNIHLKSRNNFLKDKEKVSKYNLKDKSVLIMTAKINILVIYYEKPLSVEIMTDATVNDLKEEINLIHEIEMENSILICEGQELDDGDKTLNVYGIDEKSTLVLKIKIKLEIKFNDENLEVDIFPETTVQQLKSLLVNKFHIEIEKFYLQFKENILVDDKDIKSYGMEHGSTLVICSKMILTVKYGGTNYSINVTPEETIFNVKKLLSEKLHIEMTHIKLKLRSNFLDDHENISKYKITDNSILIMSVKIHVTVIQQDDKFPLHIYSDATISELKEELKADYGIDLDDNTLEFDGKILEDDKTLNSYGIVENSILTWKAKIKLVIKFNDESQEIKIFPQSKICQLQSVIMDKFNIGKEKIYLLYEEKILLDDECIESYGIENESVLILRSKATVTINYYGTEFDIFILPSETILDLRRLLSEKYQVTVSNILLRFNEIDLQDSDKINSYIDINGDKRHFKIFMRIKLKFVVNYCESPREIEMESTERVLAIKNALGNQMGINIHMIELQIEDKKLLDEDEISKYETKNRNKMIMRVKIKVKIEFGNKNYTIDVYTDTKVLEVKKQVTDKYKIDNDNINLYFNNNLLPNNDIINIWQIREDSKLTMTTKIAILVEYRQQKFSVELQSDDFLSKLKQEVARLRSMDSNKFCLKLHGVILSDEKKMFEYGIENKSKLTMATKESLTIEFYEKTKPTFDIWTDSTVLDMKKQIAEKYKLKDDRICLIYNDTVLKNEQIYQDVLTTKSKFKMTLELNIEIKCNETPHKFKLSSHDEVSVLVENMSRLTGIVENSFCFKKDKIYLKKNKPLYNFFEGSSFEITNILMIRKMEVCVSFDQCAKKYNKVENSDVKVGKLKDDLSKYFDVNVDRIHLQNEKELNNENELGNFGIDKLNLTMKKKIKVLGKIGDSEYTLVILPDATVSLLKSLIATKTNSAIDRIQINVNGVNLEDAKTLKESGVIDESRVIIVTNVDGGKILSKIPSWLLLRYKKYIY